jgi:hypothetical protein
MTRLHLLEAWNSYRAQVIPADASPVQLTECKRAFFAGAGSVWSLYVAAAEKPPHLPDPQILESIDTELRQFLARVKAGVM